MPLEKEIKMAEQEDPNKGINSKIRYNTCKYICINIETLKHIQQILKDVKREIASTTIIVKQFKTLFISMDGSSRQKPNKKILTRWNTFDQME